MKTGNNKSSTKEQSCIQGSECPFCHPDPSREIIAESPGAFAIFDLFPVSKGHALIIPRKHCPDYFELSFEEQSGCWQLINEVKILVENLFHPDGFNVGININHAAGQTIPHVHIHLIPRYTDDVSDPRGGIRGVIPNRRSY